MATKEREDARRYRTAEDGDQFVIYDRENPKAWVASTYTVEIGGGKYPTRLLASYADSSGT